MLDFDAICRGRTSSVSSCFPSEVDFERYLSCLELLVEVQSLIFNIFLMILRLRSKILNLSWEALGRHALVFDAWFWRYLSWPDALLRLLGHFAANQSWLNQVGDRWISSAFRVYFLTFRSRLWTLFVVFQSTWPFYCLSSMFDFDAICRGRTSFGGHCFSSMLDLDAICRGRKHFWKSLLAFDAWFWRWATYRISVSFLNAVEFRNALEQLIFSQRSASLKLISMLSSQLVWDM